MLLGVEDFALVGRSDIGSGDRAFFVHAEHDAMRVVVVGIELDLFEIEDDFHHVLDDAGNGLELVIDSLDLDRGDGGTFERGEEHAAERVADGVAVAGLEGFRGEFRVGVGGSLLILDERLGHFETSKTNWHNVGWYDVSPGFPWRV